MLRQLRRLRVEGPSLGHRGPLPCRCTLRATRSTRWKELSPSSAETEVSHPACSSQYKLTPLPADLPFSQLVFKVDRRLSGMSSNPLPPSPADRRAYEDALMAAFVASPEFFDCHADQQGMIHNLYGRYRAVPGSLTEDQEALVYAVLCLARYKELQKEMNAKWPLGSAGREDVTYYHMAYDALANWARPSLPAICEWRVKRGGVLTCSTCAELTLSRGTLLPRPVRDWDRRRRRDQGPHAAMGVADQGARHAPPGHGVAVCAARGRPAVCCVPLHRRVSPPTRMPLLTRPSASAHH